DYRGYGVLVNHSCEPNSGIINDYYLIALEDIPANVEIRYDYSTTMDEDSFTMECRCMKSECRRYVSDFKTLSEETKRKYLSLGIVMSFIANQYQDSSPPLSGARM